MSDEHAMGLDDIEATEDATGPPIPIVDEGSRNLCLKGGVLVTFVCVVRLGTVASLHAIDAGLVALGSLKWDLGADGDIAGLDVRPDARRIGVATALWKAAHALSAQQGWPPPRHTTDRTDDGDSWARAVGGSLPEPDRDVT
jgi:GNAT superfamily N-acetyltransferase